MNFREIYQLSFEVLRLRDGSKEPNCRPEVDAGHVAVGGDRSIFLAIMFSHYRHLRDINPMLEDIDFAIAHPNFLDDSYRADGIIEVFFYQGQLRLNTRNDPHASDNESLPLADAKGLLLKWKDFVSRV